MLNIKRLPELFTFGRFENDIWMVVIVRFITMLGFAVYGPYFMLYLNRDRGLTMTLAGVIVALANLGGAFSQTLGGKFADRFGRRQTMLLFYGINTLTTIGLTLMVSVSTTVWLFALVYILVGFVWGMAQPAANAVITDQAARGTLTEAYGLSQIGLNLGWIIGPLLGGYMYSRFAFTYLVAISIFTNLISFSLALGMSNSFSGDKKGISLRSFFSVGPDRSLITFVLLNFMVFTVYVQMANTYAVFTVKQLRFATTQYGLLMTINAVVAVVFQYPVTRMVGSWLGDKNALFGGSLLFAAGYLSLSWITGFGWSVAAIVIITLGELLFVPSSNSIVGLLAGPEQRGLYLGLWGTSAGLGIAMAPLLGGGLFDASHGASWLIWGPLSAITFTAAFGYLRWFSSYKERFSQ
jgi:MFS family permease